MLVYHRTDNAAAIMADGFRDVTDTWGTSNYYSGVWVSPTPLDVNEGAVGETVLALEIPDALFEEHE